MTQVSTTQTKSQLPADDLSTSGLTLPNTKPGTTPAPGIADLQLPRMMVFAQLPKVPEDDKLEAKKAKQIKDFTTAIADIEKKVDKILADDSDAKVTPQTRLKNAAKLLSDETLAAAKAAGLGEFKTINELHDHLLKNHNVLYVPSFESTRKGPRINIELARVTPVTVEEADVEKLLAGLTKVTGIKLTGKQTTYTLGEMLHDSNPNTGISANYGSSGGLPGGTPFVVVNSKLIQDDKKSYLTAPKEKERVVLANELVTTAYTNKYPKLMADPLAAFATIDGLKIGPVHVAELASDYASLTAGEHVVDVAKRMAVDNGTYALSNVIVAKALLAFCNTDARKKEILDLLDSAPKGRDPGQFALGKFLDDNPKLHDEFKKVLAEEMKSTLETITPLMDIVEARKAR